MVNLQAENSGGASTPVTLTAEQVGYAMLAAGWPLSQVETGIAVSGPGAESSWNVMATNPSGGKVDTADNPASTAYGLFQIQHSSHAALFAKEKANTGLWIDPAINSAMAYQVWKDASGSWRPWQAYTSGAYKRNLAAASKAVKSIETATAGMSASQRKAYALKKYKAEGWPKLDAMLYSTGDISKALGNITAAGGQQVQAFGKTVTTELGEWSRIADEFSNISELFSKLMLPSTWLRIGSGMFGIVAIGFGVYLLGKSAKE